MMNQRLSKIVTVGVNSSHKSFPLGFPSEIDIPADDIVFGKVSFTGGKDILRFSITWPKQVPAKVRHDFMIFISQKFRQPTEKNCDIAIQGVSYHL